MTFRRSKRIECLAATVRVWDSQCGVYRLRESTLIGEDTPVYYAQKLEDGIWTVLKRHRKRSAAVRTLERAERGLPPDPKPRPATLKRKAKRCSTTRQKLLS